MKKNLFIFFVTVITHPLLAQNFCQIQGEAILLDNGELSRSIMIRNDSLYSTRLLLASGDYNYIIKSRDFSFMVNDKEISGYSGWKLIGSEKIVDPTGGKGVKIRLQESGANPLLEIEINYMLYPGLPLVRKWISFINTGNTDFKIESLIIEDLETNQRARSNVIYHDYARNKHLGRFIGNWFDPVVVVHDIPNRLGMALGNETISVLKRTAYHTESKSNNIEIGLTKTDQVYPFRKWLEPGETWESPKVFICLYANRDDGFQVVNEEVNAFMIKHMEPRIIEVSSKPTFVYNTWIPFHANIDAEMVRELARAAAECGVEEFIIDDGWQMNALGAPRNYQYGDWLVHKEKFPDGLKPVFDYIKSLGMKPGLWISIADATEDSRVFREHPEWFTEGPDHKPWSLHVEGDRGRYTASFGSEWYDYIKNTILRLINEHGLAYGKFDLAVVTSAYVNKDMQSGSFARNHLYRDHEESFIVIYERVLQLFSEIHKEAPDFFIDCTFETAGKLQLTDYAVSKYAEGNWLSNFQEPSPLGPLRVRQMAWWRTPAMPASSLVIGNQQLDDQNIEFVIKSLIGTLPIVLGDPRKLSETERAKIKDWSVWMRSMQDKHDYMTYRKDLPGFGEPGEGAWDGWQRINFQTGEGGIFGVFRQGALEDSRKVFLNDLTPDETYVVKRAPYGETVHKATGKELMEEGFTVRLGEKYDADVFEVSLE